SRLEFHPARPAVGDRTALLIHLLGPPPSPSPGGGPQAGGSCVFVTASISGPGRQTLPLNIDQSPVDSRLFRSRFRANEAGPWHARVLVFAADGKGGESSGDPLCYGSQRFVVL